MVNDCQSVKGLTCLRLLSKSRIFVFYLELEIVSKSEKCQRLTIQYLKTLNLHCSYSVHL